MRVLEIFRLLGNKRWKLQVLILGIEEISNLSILLEREHKKAA